MNFIQMLANNSRDPSVSWSLRIQGEIFKLLNLLIFFLRFYARKVQWSMYNQVIFWEHPKMKTDLSPIFFFHSWTIFSDLFIFFMCLLTTFFLFLIRWDSLRPRKLFGFHEEFYHSSDCLNTILFETMEQHARFV